MSQDRKEISWAYRFGGVGILFLAGGVCTLSIFFTTGIGGILSLITGLLSIGMGLFLYGYAYRSIILPSESKVVKEQLLSLQSSATSTQTIKTEATTQTMTCFRCDATIPSKANFCPKCGSAVSSVAST